MDIYGLRHTCRGKNQFHFSSHNTNIVHVKVQITQSCIKQIGVWTDPNREKFVLLSDQELENMWVYPCLKHRITWDMQNQE